MLSAKYLALKILVAVNYCGRQLARRLGWAAPVKGWGGRHLSKVGVGGTCQRLGWAALSKVGVGGTCLPLKERCNPASWTCKYSLQYDGRLDWRFGVRVGTWNVGSPSGNWGEACKEQ